VKYSCHLTSNCFTFPIFVHSWCFSVFHSLRSITPCAYQLNTPIHLLNLKIKHELRFIHFPRRELCCHRWILRTGGRLPHPLVAEPVSAR
jgi:hypothetical protein